MMQENNRQYYEGAQGFTATGTGSAESFTTTFDTDLIFNAVSSATPSYALNNFKLYTSPTGAASTYTEYTGPYTVSGNTITISGIQSQTLNLAAPNSINNVIITKNTLTSTIIAGDTLSMPSATWDGTGSIGATTSAVITSITDTGTQLQLFWNPAIYGNATYGPGVQVFINPLTSGTQIVVQLKKLDGGNYGNTIGEKAFGNIVEENYGSYAYARLGDIVNNFLIAYVGVGKLIPSVKRTDVIFHAKRAIQEFSYDTLRSVNAQELTVPKNLSVVLPQDYVNYVEVSWSDTQGVKHIIYPTRLTSNPSEMPLQDNQGVPIQDAFNENVEVSSIIEKRWKNNSLSELNQIEQNSLISYDYYYANGGNMYGYGQLYGLEPELANVNGSFTINEREGKFSFSANLVDKIILLEYISDGLSNDLDTKVPKMAEEAMYAYLKHAILSSRINQPEYVIQRFKKEASAKLRNAKIRLSNIKSNEIVQVMRGKSKWIKH